MYSQRPLKHLILYIFNSFMIFYYPTPFPIIPIFVTAQIMIMRCHKWLYATHSIASRKKVQPPRG